jgi:uncharacterized C2H2 Zn-finger protein
MLDASMDYLPQLVGKRCSRCDKVISSITDGAFCSCCYNPVHNKCRPSVRPVVPSGYCSSCGADPESKVAREIRAEVKQELADGYPKLQCPRCGSSHGFKPYGSQTESSEPNISSIRDFVLLALLESILGLGRLANKLANNGLYECLRCSHVFRSARRSSGHRWIVLLVVASVAGVLIAAMCMSF